MRCRSRAIVSGAGSCNVPSSVPVREPNQFISSGDGIVNFFWRRSGSLGHASSKECGPARYKIVGVTARGSATRQGS